MASPQPWPPYAASRDCSMGFCSIYCPQWCYFYFSPPPPPSHSTTFTLPPLLIAIIVVVSSAFFVITGYLIAFKFCNQPHPAASSSSFAPPTETTTTWISTPSSGLDESLINKLTTYRYRDGPIADSDRDCSVCLGEFREEDLLRLLPKCGHAFHQSCIDTWLKSHSNCPLCRASVAGPAQLAETETEVEVVVAAVAHQNSEDDSGSPEATRRSDGDVGLAIEIVEEEDGVTESSAGRSQVLVKRSSTSELTSSRHLPF